MGDVRTTLGLALVGVAIALGACSSAPASSSASGPSIPVASPSSGSPSPAPSVDSPQAASPSASEVATMSPESFTLTSTAFDDGGAIPRHYTCDGDNASPELAWSGAPAETRALVLTVVDPDARDFVHWLVYDMEGTPSGTLPRAISASPDAPPQGTNSFGKRGYGGPCPPSGTHHYRFTISALDAVVELTGAPRAAELEAAMSGHVLAEATLTGTYRRS
jgi:Raf kinase inhibitor-like YbhB/YbcL family protein